MADVLAISGMAISVPSLFVPDEAAAAFLAIALGSNLPAYGAGDAGVSTGVAGDMGEATADSCAFLSISASRLRVPPEASSSFCLRSFSAACFCFHASSFASLSAFFASSVCVGVAACWRLVIAEVECRGHTSFPLVFEDLSLLPSLLPFRLESADSSLRLRARSRESSL